MELYFYLYLGVALMIAILFARFLILKKKNIPIRLFSLALKNENSGHLEEAIVNYESALLEVEKIRFHSELKKKIVEKLKVLKMMVEYDNNSHFTR